MKIFSVYDATQLNAGPKAKVDVEKILVKNYNAKDKVLLQKKKTYKIKGLLYYIFYGGKDLAVFNFPYSKREYIYDKFKNKIAFIHDIEGLRTNNEEELKHELRILNKFNYLVVHNDTMKNFLKEHGIDENKMFVLEIFDYLCFMEKAERNFDKNNITVVYTGNFNKSPFLNQLESNKMNFKMNLYGVGNFENQENDKLILCGAYKPNELPNHIKGDLGLVWDGLNDSSDEDVLFKNYTKYNNPHKFSCYLAARLPVIVWEKAAIAKTVKKYNIGYTISNIYDINNLDFSDYMEKLENVKDLQEKVRSGYFTKRVMDEILNK